MLLFPSAIDRPNKLFFSLSRKKLIELACVNLLVQFFKLDIFEIRVPFSRIEFVMFVSTANMSI